MTARWWSFTVAAILLVSLAGITSCAKRPTTASVAVPAQASAPAKPGAGAPASSGEVKSSGSPSTTSRPGAGGTSAVTPAQPSLSILQPAPSEFVATDALKDIYFDFDKSNIRSTEIKRLDQNATWLKSNPAMPVLIEGHADERGTDEYNLALGERRARTTMNYLVTSGIQANRISIISYGENRPVCAEKNEACWAKNRRAHFLVKLQ